MNVINLKQNDNNVDKIFEPGVNEETNIPNIY